MSRSVSAQNGLSLIECLLAVAITALLSAMAVPMQAQAWQRAQRAQARLALAQASWWLEREAGWSGAYPAQMPDSVWASDRLSYVLSYAPNNGGYVLRASPAGPQSGDGCGTLWINEQGSTGADGGNRACW
jgi:type IV pilus assembly protein PilE